jgi:hypothetical protein
LLGGLAIFVVGFLFWGTPLSALAFHRAEGQATANLQAALAQTLPATGVYVVPDPSTAEGTILYGKGPVAQIFYNSGGFPVTDGASLIGGLILALVVGVLIALALRYVASDAASRLRFSVLIGLVPALWIDIGQAVFNHAPWGYCLYLALSDFAALALAGLIASKLMPGARMAAAPAPDATMH